jgi:tetratricopeptide (TPR) repeat protein
MGNLAGVASCRINIGTVERELGQLDQSLDDFAKSLAMSEKMQNPELIAQATINLGEIHIDIGDLERAEFYAWKALELTTKSGIKRDEGKSWELLGDVNYERGNFSWALDCYRRGKHSMEALTSRREEGRLMLEIKILDASCRIETEGIWEKDILGTFLMGGAEQKEVKTQAELRISRTLLDKGGDPAMALLLLTEATERLGSRCPRILLLWRLTSLIARAYREAGKEKEAAATARLAASYLRKIRRSMRRKWVEKSFLERREVRSFLSLRNALASKG